VLFEMLTGTGPTGDASKESLIRRRMAEPPPRPSVYRAELPKALDDLVVRALARDPAVRVQSAVEMRRALDAVVVAPPSAPPSPRTWRRWIRPAAAAVAALIMIAVWPPRSARQTTRPTIAMSPVVASPPLAAAPSVEARPAPPPPPRDPPSDALTEADRELRLSRYFAAKEPPDFPRAIQLLRHALGLVDALVARYPRSPPIAKRRLTLDSLLGETLHECIALHETSCE
jgi:serine/threonine protein kinase